MENKTKKKNNFRITSTITIQKHSLIIAGKQNWKCNIATSWTDEMNKYNIYNPKVSLQ